MCCRAQTVPMLLFPSFLHGHSDAALRDVSLQTKQRIIRREEPFQKEKKPFELLGLGLAPVLRKHKSKNG
jgi:hypothetical protein